MTADAGFVCASRRPQRAGDANCRRCNSIAADAMPARSIGLVSPATVCFMRETTPRLVRLGGGSA